MTGYVIPVNRGRPRIVADLRHPINRSGACWYTSLAQNRSAYDLLGRNASVAVLGAGGSFGPPNQVNPQPWANPAAGATGFIDLGPNYNFLQDLHQPGCTISWISKSNAATNYQGVVCLMTVGTATPFVVGQANDVNANPGFGHVWAGLRDGAANTMAWMGPPAVSANKENVFVLVLLHALNSTTKADYILYWGGPGGFGSAIADGTVTQANNITRANNFGFDGNTFDFKFSGTFDNLRVWNRPLAPHEAWSVLNNPLIGSITRVPQFMPIHAFRPWLAMPTGWLS